MSRRRGMRCSGSSKGDFATPARHRRDGRRAGPVAAASPMPLRARYVVKGEARGARDGSRFLAPRDRDGTRSRPAEWNRRSLRERALRTRRPSSTSSSTSSTRASALSTGCRISPAGHAWWRGFCGRGGRLYLVEGHPMLWALEDGRDDGRLVVSATYFETAEPNRWADGVDYADPSATLQNSVTYEWNHGLGENRDCADRGRHGDRVAARAPDGLLESAPTHDRGLGKRRLGRQGRVGPARRAAREPAADVLDPGAPRVNYRGWLGSDRGRLPRKCSPGGGAAMAVLQLRSLPA